MFSRSEDETDTDTRQGTQQPRCGTSACPVDTFPFRLGTLFRARSRF